MNRFTKIFIGVLVVLVLVAVVVHAILPSVIKRQANKTLQSLPDYTGRVADVDLSLLRGAFQLDDLRIKHRNGDMALTVKEVDFSISWANLFRKAVVANLTIETPRLRMLVPSPAEAAKQSKDKAKDVDKAVKAKTGQSLPDLLANAIPFRVDNFRLNNGTIRLREKGQDINKEVAKDEAKDEDAEDEDKKEPGKEIRVTDIEVAVDNLTNSKKISDSMMAEGHASANIMNRAPVNMDLKINPMAKEPTFDLNVSVKEFNLADLNSLFRWQAGIDVEEGTFSMFAEAAAADGGFQGYVKPIVQNLDVINLDEDKKKPLKVIKEAIVGAVATVLENKKEDQVATRIPFEGKFDNPRVGLWTAVFTVLRNAFIEALRPRLDRTVDMKKVSD